MRIAHASLPTLIVLLLAGNAFAQTNAAQQPPIPSTQPPANQPAGDLPAIDTPLKVVSLTIVLAEGPTSALPDDKSPEELLPLVEELARGNELTNYTRLQLAAADGQPAFVQNGEQAAVPQGDARVVGGRVTTRSYTRQAVGTSVRCTPRVVDGAVVASLEIEESRLVPVARPMGAPEEPVVEPPPSVQTAVARSVVTIPTGKAVLVSGQRTTAPDGKSRQSLILVTAKVLD